jgi:hypothetical protein
METTLEEKRTVRGEAPSAEFDLRGWVGIRLIGATAKDVDVVTRQLGPIRAKLERDPDIVIRFVDRFETKAPMRFLGLDDCAFAGEDFLVLRSKQKSRAKVVIPFDQIGGRCEIVCEGGLAAVPHLIAIVNLTALAKGVLPFHASAFRYRDVGVLTTGWAKGGKTESLLAFAAEGASYVGDEWVYLATDGAGRSEMFGIPEPIRIWDWHLRQLPRTRERLARNDRVRLALLQALVRGIDGACRSRGKAAKLARRALPVVKRQQWVQLPPEELFGRIESSARPEKLFLMASHDSEAIVVRRATAEEIARRMVFSLQEESLELASCYLKFRFAFPARRNEWIENAENIQRERLLRALSGLESFVVDHPYPVGFSALFRAMEPHVRRGH